LNWDDLELVAQPTESTCWAAAAAMVVGWDKQISLTPETVAEFTGRATNEGLPFNDFASFAKAIGLAAEPPQSYSVEGFRQLLESSGPLWVGVFPSTGGHAIVVTGMYTDGVADGSGTFIRIADPWDRIVGTPGAPGNYLQTHNTGSRYILSLADFVKEYEAAASTDPAGTVNTQVLHASGTRGRVPNRASPPSGYALTASAAHAKLPSRKKAKTAQAHALDGPAISLNWDDLELVAQPTEVTCWAAAASMVVGWDKQISLTPETVAEIAGRATNQGLPWNDRASFAAAIGLVAEPPQSYSVEGFRQLLESSGPLYVGVFPSTGGHAIVVTGMYTDGVPDGSGTFIRIADPWDRIVGTPGAPGNYLQTHNTGSRYILSLADFVKEYEAAVSTDPAGTVNTQVLHASGTSGRVPNKLSPPSGYAMAATASAAHDKLPKPPPPKIRATELDAGVVEIASVVIGAVMTRVTNSDSGIDWELDQLNGLKHPNDQAPTPSAPFRDARTIRLDDWPYVEALDRDRISADFTIDWQYNGLSLGNIRITNVGTNGAILQKLHVKAQIMNDSILYTSTALDPSTAPRMAALRVRMYYRFTRAIGSDAIAITDLHLYGNGTYDQAGHWEQY
jgi:hypothetical protein